jgi:hypothetical protein
MTDALTILTGRDEMTLWHAALWIDFGLFVTRPLWRLGRSARRHPINVGTWPVFSTSGLIAGYMGVAVMVNALLLGRVLDPGRAGGLVLAGLLGLAAALWVFWSVARLCRCGGGWSLAWTFGVCGALHMGCLCAAWLGVNQREGAIDPGPLALPLAGLLATIAAVLVFMVLREGRRAKPPA